MGKRRTLGPSPESTAEAAADRLHNRFLNLVVEEDIESDEQERPYKKVYRCTSPNGPRLSGRVYPNGSLAVEIDMLSSKEFEKVMAALWQDRDGRVKPQYVFTVGAKPKPNRPRKEPKVVKSTKGR